MQKVDGSQLYCVVYHQRGVTCLSVEYLLCTQLEIIDELVWSETTCRGHAWGVQLGGDGSNFNVLICYPMSLRIFHIVSSSKVNLNSPSTNTNHLLVFANVCDVSILMFHGTSQTSVEPSVKCDCYFTAFAGTEWDSNLNTVQFAV